MAETLLERLSSRLRELDKGGYARQYVTGKARFGGSLPMTVYEIIAALGVSSRRNVLLPGTRTRADLEVNGVYAFVDRRLGAAEMRRLSRAGSKCVFIESSDYRSDREDSGIKVIRVDTGRSGDLQTIFLDDPSFNFDYAHILPKTQKCSVMHGHTSSALVEITGVPVDDMVVDFGLAKDAIREAIRSLDHKLFINRKYIVKRSPGRVTLRFRTVHGQFTITAPRQTTVLLKGEATVERLAREVLTRVAARMPPNVTSVGVYVYEGLNKGTHLLAQLHQREMAERRKKR